MRNRYCGLGRLKGGLIRQSPCIVRFGVVGRGKVWFVSVRHGMAGQGDRKGGFMEVDTLRRHLKQLEDDIQSSVSMLVEAFKKRTNHAPFTISIEMAEVTKIEDVEPQFLVANCRASIEL